MTLLCGMCAVLAAALIGPHPESAAATGRVVDRATRQPVPQAVVVAGDGEVRTDNDGMFRLPGNTVGTIRIRAHGYRREEVVIDGRAGTTDVALAPIAPKAVYLSVYGVGNRALREAALDLIETTELNAVVIDVKGDRGLIGYRSAIPLAAQVGAQRVITMPDLPALLTMLRNKGIYTIARIVVFKDDLLASSRPELALRRRNGAVYRDREHLSWSDPFKAEVRRYNVDIAREAAGAGFDEIQFDYVRLPDATGLAYPVADTEESRVAAITGFVREAREALRPYNVFLAVDVFGYVCWNTTDTGIGQRLESLAEVADYISPMLYPSSFQFGIPGYRNPVQHPYEIVRVTLERALARTGVPAVRFRPWIQSFADYAFRGGSFTSGEVRRQIAAAEDAGTNGWMLWNPRNRYSAADLRRADSP